MEDIVKIISIERVTHDVKHYRVEKPKGYTFQPGQATEVAINKAQWKDERRPFTFTGLNEWPHLEFTIKSYRDHDGVTNNLDNLKQGDELIIHDVWGAISYNGPGYFIAGGAGVTPFIAIFRQLYKDNLVEDNELFFSNKTSADIIMKDGFEKMLGDKVHFILTQEGNKKEYIDKAYLQTHIKNFSKPFYICGPDKMVEGISNILKELGAKPEALVFEK
ncbi:MAG: flavodoxin reductase [Chitinophagaceae bacterium]|nr:flavodoxin reductase [Chitinophagaceae bacterium]